MKKLTQEQIRAFRRKVYGYFSVHGRDFPWRRTKDPYHIFVSEVMLQQTQVQRAAVKFPEFVEAFPDFGKLAAAPLAAVLKVWQGMGYNRRALYLRQAAQIIVERFGGKLPHTVDALETLPGIGPSTARSIAVFAFNVPVCFIETNIRAAYIHDFFGDTLNVSDDDILPILEQTCDRTHPWKWYSALMDYGTMLKAVHANPSRRSAHYKKQAPFATSDRRIRGEILRYVTRQGPLTERQLTALVPFLPSRILRCIASLVREGLLARINSRYCLP